MIRILLYLLAVFAIGLGLAWLADRPGDMVVTFEGYRYQASLLVAVTLAVALVAAVMIVWWLLKSLWNSPHAVSRYFRARRRDRGYQALSTGMIAAGAGDSGLAKRKNAEALKLIRSDQEPLIHLLEAQTLLLEGDHDGARRKFDAMVDDPETRLLGLRGLFLEAERLGDRDAARHYAARAAESAPQLHWAAEASLEGRTAAGDWDGALRLVEARRPAREAERLALARDRAVLLTAKSQATLDTDPAGARAAALEANRLSPDLVPAALAAARALFRLGDVKKGARILETQWKREAHPEIAELYVHARPGDSTHDRLERARRLASIKQNNAESSLALARAALAAQEFGEAREAALAALRMAPREGVYRLLADIEEADGGNEGRMRQYLSRALRAPADPAWVADGVVSAEWQPVSPVTGRLDAFEWRAPVERLGQVIEVEDVADPRSLGAPVSGEVLPPAAAAASASPSRPVSEASAPAPAAAEALPAGQADPDGLEDDEPPLSDNPAADEPAPITLPERADGQVNGGTEPDGAQAPRAARPLPDDPGVDPREDAAPERRFRLF
jgi:HemY protein